MHLATEQKGLKSGNAYQLSDMACKQLESQSDQKCIAEILKYGP